jgi:serine phosphatase RsbU (regulator of sigma subunit)
MAEEKTILVVEDDPVSRHLLSTALTRAGYRVTVAGGGREGAAFLARLPATGEGIDLLMTDIMMPEFSGLDLIDEMNRLGIGCPVFAVTAFGDKEIVVELLRRGVVEFIEKPVNVGELIHRVRNVLSARDRAEAALPPERRAGMERHAMARMRAEMDSAMAAYQSLVPLPAAGHKVGAACFSRPLAGLGGDFAGIQDTDTGCDILVADVSGHDMGAAFHTVLIKTLFSENSATAGDGETLFRRLNQRLMGDDGDDRMATALFLRLDLKAKEAEAVCAGHPPLIRLHPSGRISSLQDLSGDILGVFETVSFSPSRFPLMPGDRIFLYTDGVTGAGRIEGAGGQERALDASGLCGLIAAHRHLPIREMVAAVGRSVVAYGGYALRDDILLVGIEIPDIP